MIMICMMYFDCANCIFIVCAGLPRCLKRFDLYACIIMHMHFCVCTCSICVYIYMCVCVFVHMYIYIYTCVYVDKSPDPFFTRVCCHVWQLKHHQARALRVPNCRGPSPRGVAGPSGRLDWPLRSTFPSQIYIGRLKKYLYAYMSA